MGESCVKPQTYRSHNMKRLRQKRVKDQENTFSTIDDAIHMARTLEGCLTKLAEYKYPLGVRKGVSKLTVENKRENENLIVKAGSRTYFFDLQKTKAGKPFLTITESRYKGPDEERERNTVTVFPEQVEEFSQALVQVIEQVKME